MAIVGGVIFVILILIILLICYRNRRNSANAKNNEKRATSYHRDIASENNMYDIYHNGYTSANINMEPICGKSEECNDETLKQPPENEMPDSHEPKFFNPILDAISQADDQRSFNSKT